MSQNVNDLLYPYKVGSMSISYSMNYADSLWDGTIELLGGTILTEFGPAHKSGFSDAEQASLSKAIALWDTYSALSITQTAGSGSHARRMAGRWCRRRGIWFSNFYLRT